MRRLFTVTDCIVHQPDGHEIGIHADRLEVDTNGAVTYRFPGLHGACLELSSRKVLHARLVDEATPDQVPADEAVLEPKGSTG